jgi:sugar/nucleoside kinase (ribokinase family)
MRVLRIDQSSPYHQLIGVGGIGTGIFFNLEGNDTLGRNESRPGRLLDVRDYCKLHIVIHYVAKLLGARISGSPFHVLPLGRVGEDASGRQVVREMTEVGIDTRLVQATSQRPTLFSVCFQYPDGAGGNITTTNSAASALCNSDIDGVADLLRSGGKQVIALAVPEVALDVRQHFLQLATQTGAFRVASFVQAEIGPARQAGMFEMLDLVSLNEAEAGELIGCSFSSAAANAFVLKCQAFLRSSYPNLRMVVSVGKDGAYGVTSDLWNYCPAPDVEVASTAGAGDALLGGTLAALAAGIPFLQGESSREWTPARIETALELGVLLASYKCMSPHTIHPSAGIETLIRFGREVGRHFSAQIQDLLTTPVLASS